MINDTFCLLNVIFSSELGELVLRSEDIVSCAELDAGWVGYNSPFWKMMESRFNSSFQPDEVDGIANADLIHHIHPLFHQNDTTIDPCAHSQFSAEKPRSAWKDLQAEYNTVTDITKPGNDDSSFTRAAMTLNNLNPP
jgi:hypothetical protein